MEFWGWGYMQMSCVRSVLRTFNTFFYEEDLDFWNLVEFLVLYNSSNVSTLLKMKFVLLYSPVHCDLMDYISLVASE